MGETTKTNNLYQYIMLLGEEPVVDGKNVLVLAGMELMCLTAASYKSHVLDS